MNIVKNTSGYSNRALRSIICRVHSEMVKLEGRKAPNWESLRIVVRGRKRASYTTGSAYLHGRGNHRYDVVFTLPRELSERRFAWIVYHELMHTYGYVHSQYTDLSERQLDDFGFGHELIPLAATKKRVARNMKAERHLSAIRRLREWQTKEKRARNAIKKLQRIIRYYDRQRAALQVTDPQVTQPE